jgi:hypothetical protein
LQEVSLFLGYGPPPQLSGDTLLTKNLAAVIVDPYAQQWEGGEGISVYRQGQAQQAMASLARLAARCATSVQVEDNNGVHISTREHLIKLAGMGDQALDIEVRSTVNGAIMSADWIIIRSGRCLLTVSQQPASGTDITQYLQVAARAAWRAFENGT